MGIQVKLKDTILTFGEWQSHDPTFAWGLPLVSERVTKNMSQIDYLLWDEGYRIILLYFDRWELKFKTPMSYGLGNLYKSLYGPSHFDSTKYSSATDWKLHVEKFLHQINSLKAFL
jgi:hypothetical protein